MCAQDQLHELYHYKLNEQRALDTPQVRRPPLLPVGVSLEPMLGTRTVTRVSLLMELWSGYWPDAHTRAQGGIKARRPSAPASAPAALAPPLQRCRPASLELACSDATDLCELAGERGRVQAAGRGCEGWRAAAGADCKGGAACCAARGGDAAGGGAVHGADAELSSLMRTLSPSDFSFSELLSGEGGRAGSAFARGGSGVRRSLNFEAEACAARGLCDSSAPLQRPLTACPAPVNWPAGLSIAWGWAGAGCADRPAVLTLAGVYQGRCLLMLAG